MKRLCFFFHAGQILLLLECFTAMMGHMDDLRQSFSFIVRFACQAACGRGPPYRGFSGSFRPLLACREAFLDILSYSSWRYPPFAEDFNYILSNKAELEAGHFLAAS